MYIWRHDICHVTASRWCHICQNVSPIPSNRYYETIFAVGIIKKVTGEKRQGVVPPGRPRVNIILLTTTKTQVKNSAVPVLPWPALPAKYDVIINRKTLFRGACRRRITHYYYWRSTRNAYIIHNNVGQKYRIAAASAVTAQQRQFADSIVRQKPDKQTGSWGR